MPVDVLEAATTLINLSGDLFAKSAAIPSGADFSRRFALQSTVKKCSVSLLDRLAAVTSRLLALQGCPVSAVSADGLVLDGIDLALRRADRAENMIEPKKKARIRKKRSYASELPSISALLTSEAKRARTLDKEPPLIAPIGQTAFDDRVLYRRKKDNYLLRFVPTGLEEKPHALRPLSAAQSGSDADHLSPATPLTDLQSLRQFLTISQGEYERGRLPIAGPHPYEEELEALSALYAGTDDAWGYECIKRMRKKLFEISKPHLYEDVLDADPPIYIDSDEKLQSFVDKLLEDGVDEIAVDVEHHSRFSYRGFTCLIQLSTKDQDYIIDPHLISNMNILNQIFACPSILKILHGSRYDVVWLQSDFSLYLVNVFDTYFASSLLSTPGGNSLANLVDFYCQVKLDKKYQVSDWRVRPLSPEQVEYARRDTHYLLYIFHCMRNQLLSRKNDGDVTPVYDAEAKPTSRGRKQLMQVLEDSRKLCLQVVSYAPVPFSSKAERIILRSCQPVAPMVHDILTYLLVWRDLKARALDVSPSSIVTDPMLLNIAMKCPRSKSALQQLMQARNPACEDVLVIITQAVISLPLQQSEKIVGSTATTSKVTAPARVERSEDEGGVEAKEEVKVESEEISFPPLCPVERMSADDPPRPLPKVIVRGSFTTRTRKNQMITRNFGPNFPLESPLRSIKIKKKKSGHEKKKSTKKGSINVDDGVALTEKNSAAKIEGKKASKVISVESTKRKKARDRSETPKKRRVVS